MPFVSPVRKCIIEVDAVVSVLCGLSWWGLVCVCVWSCLFLRASAKPIAPIEQQQSLLCNLLRYIIDMVTCWLGSLVCMFTSAAYFHSLTCRWRPVLAQ